MSSNPNANPTGTYTVKIDCQLNGEVYTPGAQITMSVHEARGLIARKMIEPCDAGDKKPEAPEKTTDSEETPGGEETADSAGEETPDGAGEETPDGAGEETPDGAGEETPDGAGEETPDGAGEETPDGAGEETPDGAGEETPDGAGGKKKKKKKKKS